MLELLKVGIASNNRNINSFTPMQLKLLKENAGKVPVSRLEEMLSKSSPSIYKKAKELGISLNSAEGAA